MATKTAELVLYTHPMSRGRMARWMLEEVGQPYRAEIIDYGPAMKSAAYRTINPMGKVPALVHGGTVVTECPAILAYLAEAFPAAGLAPAPSDLPRRGAYYRWLFFAAGPLEAAATNKAMGFKLEGPRQSGMAGYGSMDDVLATLEVFLKDRSFVTGDRFSAADLYLSAHLGWGMQFGTLEKRPAFEAYVARHFARDAARRANEIDEALAKQHPMPGAG